MAKPKLRVVPATESEDGQAHFFVNDKEVSSDDYNKANNAANNSNPALEDEDNAPSQNTSSDQSDISKLDMDGVKQQIEELPKITDDTPVEERRQIRAQANALSKRAGELRKKELANIEDEDEKQILTLYNQGVQNYEIAKRVFKFVNQDTVGQVVLTIRKHHANDFDQVEDINSTKGYTGVSR